MHDGMFDRVPQEELDVILACTDVVGRSGARNFEMGYLHDGVPTDQAGWWARAQYGGYRMTVEGASPADVAEKLCERVLRGAKCLCGKLVALDPEAAFAYFDVTLRDGTRWTAAQAAEAGQCLWQRDGPKWVRGCEARQAKTPKHTPTVPGPRPGQKPDRRRRGK